MIRVRVRDDDLFHVAQAETAGRQHSRQLVDRAGLQGAGVNDGDRRVDQQVAIDAPDMKRRRQTHTDYTVGQRLDKRRQHGRHQGSVTICGIESPLESTNSTACRRNSGEHGERLDGMDTSFLPDAGGPSARVSTNAGHLHSDCATARRAHDGQAPWRCRVQGRLSHKPWRHERGSELDGEQRGALLMARSACDHASGSRRRHPRPAPAQRHRARRRSAALCTDSSGLWPPVSRRRPPRRRGSRDRRSWSG